MQEPRAYSPQGKDSDTTEHACVHTQGQTYTALNSCWAESPKLYKIILQSFARAGVSPHKAKIQPPRLPFKKWTFARIEQTWLFLQDVQVRKCGTHAKLFFSSPCQIQRARSLPLSELRFLSVNSSSLKKGDATEKLPNHFSFILCWLETSTHSVDLVLKGIWIYVLLFFSSVAEIETGQLHESPAPKQSLKFLFPSWFSE